MSTTRRIERRERVAARLEAAALELFAHRGFEETTVDEVAVAAGVGRRTFFRYFPTKTDVVLGAIDDRRAELRESLALVPPGAPVLATLREAFQRVNHYEPDELPVLRRRMYLLNTVPGLAAHAAGRYLEWEQTVADYVARQVAAPPDALFPTVVAKAVVGAMQAAYAAWLRDPHADHRELIDQAFSHLADGLEPARRPGRPVSKSSQPS